MPPCVPGRSPRGNTFHGAAVRRAVVPVNARWDAPTETSCQHLHREAEAVCLAFSLSSSSVSFPLPAPRQPRGPWGGGATRLPRSSRSPSVLAT
eukprot:ctg_502.g256